MTRPSWMTPTTPVRTSEMSERVAVDDDEVSDLARLDRADVVRHPHHARLPAWPT